MQIATREMLSKQQKKKHYCHFIALLLTKIKIFSLSQLFFQNETQQKPIESGVLRSFIIVALKQGLKSHTVLMSVSRAVLRDVVDRKTSHQEIIELFT